ncbi:MAG: FtsX-like permease family protein, partial [Clostridiales bacterium]|nr:FtsX-like permease family protein [Clostridiales bacterium]
AYGYYLVFSSKMNAVKTLVLVCIGTYGLFYAVIPIVLNSLINNKNILYKGENIITINSLAYRIKKNYTTYATIVILTACAITVLGTSVSMRKLYSMSEENDQLFSISFSSSNAINNEKISKEVTKVLGEKKFDLKTDVLMVKDNIQNGKQKYIVLPYDKFNSILKSNGYEKDLEKVNEEMVQGDKAIYIQRPGTLVTLVKANKVTVGDKTFEISESDIRFKVLGSLINYPAVVVNNSQYEKLKNSGEMLNFYGIKIKDDKELLDKDILNKLGVGLKPYLRDDINFQIGIYKTQGVEWLKLTYAIGTFLFLVFILAEASIIYIKIYSDANDDKEKYKILKNIGVSKKDLGRAIRKEVSLFYILPLSIGLLHSFFAIQALGRFLSENLNLTFIISVLVSIGIFFVSAIISNKSFKSIVKV